MHSELDKIHDNNKAIAEMDGTKVEVQVYIGSFGVTLIGRMLYANNGFNGSSFEITVADQDICLPTEWLKNAKVGLDEDGNRVIEYKGDDGFMAITQI